MFDFGVGYSEMFLIAVVAIIVIGPKDLPKVLRGFGKTVAKMRGMAREFQGHLDGAMREAGLDEVKTEIQNLKAMGSGSIIEPVSKKPVVQLPDDNDFETYFGAPAAAGTKPAEPA